MSLIDGIAWERENGAMEIVEANDLRKRIDESAIAQYRNDLESMTDDEVNRETNHIRDEIDELESWFEALIAWQRRNL